MRTPSNMFYVAPLHALETVETMRPDAGVHLIELDDPSDFVQRLPAEFSTPSQRYPNAGLPPNAWCGVVVDGHKTLARARQLLEVRARVLWVYMVSGSWSAALDLFEPWRCTRCGRRGGFPRPKHCPHARFLCGDARLEPQIQWLILDPSMDPLFGNNVKKLGVEVYPDEIPIVHELEFKEAARRLERPVDLRGVPVPRLPR